MKKQERSHNVSDANTSLTVNDIADFDGGRCWIKFILLDSYPQRTKRITYLDINILGSGFNLLTSSI